MDYALGRLRPHRSVWALALGLASAAAALAINTQIIGRRPLEKLPRDWTLQSFSPEELWIALLTVLSGAALAMALQGDLFRSGAARLQADAWSLVTGTVNIVFLGVAAALTIGWPELFLMSVDEDGAISLAQAFLIGIGFALLARLTVAGDPAGGGKIFGLPFRLLTALLSLVLFLLLMEEISWGQHLFGWQTPDTFADNIQNETNLHNFFTNRFELVFYSGAVFAFVILPYLATNQAWLHSTGAVRMIPPVSLGLAALPVTAFLFESWGIIPLQLLFFLGIALAASAALHTRGVTRALSVAMLAAMIASQLAIMSWGHNLIGRYEVAEMRELAIAWMICVYAVWLSFRHRTAAGR